MFNAILISLYILLDLRFFINTDSKKIFGAPKYEIILILSNLSFSQCCDTISSIEIAKSRKKPSYL